MKFWKQACLPALLFGSELFSITPSLLLKLEDCQHCFLRKAFHAPKFAPGILLSQLSILISVAAEIDLKKRLLLSCLITQPNMAPTMKSLFLSKMENSLDPSLPTLGIIHRIYEALQKYDLFHYFIQWFHSSISPTYAGWKKLIKLKSTEMKKDNGLNIVMTIQVCNLPKSVRKLLIGIASGQWPTSIPISLVISMHKLI